MQTPQRFRHMLSAVALGLMASGAMAMTNAEHTAAKNQIEADYKAAKEQCKPLKDNAKDVCEKQAKGQENVAKADWNRAAILRPRTAKRHSRPRLMRTTTSPRKSVTTSRATPRMSAGRMPRPPTCTPWKRPR